MNLFDKSIDNLEKKDLHNLIETQRREDRTIEYKSRLNIKTGEGKKEFAKDVSSFANSAGGLILYGVTEDNEGRPKELCGIEIENEDVFVTQIQNILQSLISPKIPAIKINLIEIQSERGVLLIYVPKSFVSPHIVKEDFRFYYRDFGKRHCMDEQELKIAFIASENVTEKIKRFRENRIMDIMANESPMKLSKNAKLLINIVPINAFESDEKLDLKKINENFSMENPIIHNWGTYFRRYNLHGFLVYRSISDGIVDRYFQVFDNGIVEYYEDSLFDISKKIFSGKKFELRTLNKVLGGLKLQDNYSIYYPRIIITSILNVKGFKISDDYEDTTYYSVDNDIVQLPEVVIEEHPQKAKNESYPGICALAETMKPVFDKLWQAVGEPCSPNYDEEGNSILRELRKQ